LSDGSLPTVTDPTSGNISSASAFTLTVDGVATTITPSGSSLEDLTSAINASGAGVQATIVNVGSNTTPDYRLAVTSNNLGGDTIELSDGTNNNLLDTLTAGTDAQYRVNGGTTDVQSTSSQVTLSPGLTVSLLAQTTAPVTVTVSSDFSALQSDLSNFVGAYNTALTAVEKNVGQNGGALQGDSIVNTLTGILGQITQYTSGSGSVSSLASLWAMAASLVSTRRLSEAPVRPMFSNFSDPSAPPLLPARGSSRVSTTISRPLPIPQTV
jgi:flagellar capping protein FliD